MSDKRDASELHAADLFLVCACAVGDERAMREFRARHESDIQSAVRKTVPASLVDDAVQHVFTKLLVASGAQPPDVAKYGGRGKLETWVRVVARRSASNLRRDAKAERDVTLKETDQLIDYATADAVLAPLKEAYRTAFRTAFASAVAQLSVRERNMLRYECIDRLSRSDIARLHDVTTMTISRWRAATRVRMRTLTREAFAAVVGIEEAEFKGVMDLIASRLEVSLTRLLGDESE